MVHNNVQKRILFRIDYSFWKNGPVGWSPRKMLGLENLYCIYVETLSSDVYLRNRPRKILIFQLRIPWKCSHFDVISEALQTEQFWLIHGAIKLGRHFMDFGYF